MSRAFLSLMVLTVVVGAGKLCAQTSSETASAADLADVTEQPPLIEQPSERRGPRLPNS
jgi:hypothetical protein